MDIPADLIYSHAGYDITSYFWSAFIEVRENGWQCCLRTLWVEFQWLVYIYYIYIYIKCLQRNKIQTICACETAPSRRTLTRILRAADFVTGASVCTAIDWTGVGLCKTKRKFWMTDNPLNCGFSWLTKLRQSLIQNAILLTIFLLTALMKQTFKIIVVSWRHFRTRSCIYLSILMLLAK